MTVHPPSDSFVGLVVLGLTVLWLTLWHTGRRLRRGVAAAVVG